MTINKMMDFLANGPPTDWEYSDWTGCKFWVQYDPRDKLWYVGYDGHGGYTTLAYHKSKRKALKFAVQIVKEGIKE